MKNLISPLLLSIALFFVFTPVAKATHAAGAELTYVWKSDSTYTLIYHFYRDCVGVPTPSDITICYRNTCDYYSNTIHLAKTTYIDAGRPNGSQVLVGCPSYPTVCNGGTVPGYEEWWYSGDVTLPSRCDQWIFSHSEYQRNAAIKNITADYLYVSATLNNRVAQGNSSPYFTVKPVPYVCDNIPYTYSNGPIDNDGDSLYFECITPMTANADCDTPYNETYLTGYDLVKNPLACDSTFTFNNTTGNMSFTPALSGAYILTVRVSEYRNISGTWTKIGSVMRDIQVVVLSCNSTTPGFQLIDSTTYGLSKRGNIYYACANVPFGFHFNIKSSDTGAKLVTTDNHTILGDTVIYTHTFADSVSGFAKWTSAVVDSGLKLFLFTAKDSSCRGLSYLPVPATFVVPVYIIPRPAIHYDTTRICPADSVSLTAVGGSGFIWNVLSGGSPLSTLSCTSCKTTVARPVVTTSYTVNASGLAGCRSHDTITVHVKPAVVPSVSITALPDHVVSMGAEYVFISTATNVGTKPAYQWYVDGNAQTLAEFYDFICTDPLTDTDVVSVVVKSNATCAYPFTDTAYIRLLPERTSVNSISNSDKTLWLYPNPNGGNFTLTAYIGNSVNEATVEIIDIAGRSIYREAIPVSNGKISKHIALKNNIPSGRYTLYLRSGNTSKSISFTLQK
ncbi:MAG: T9SS type A sorting domain-containing protein [Bacteroidetes bacterium]|nr:T9SS type A sorting domain-containing protein [Bacteroidota bacterium]